MSEAPWDPEAGVLDLSGIDENAAPKAVPAGIYRAICTEATFGKSQRTQKDMITLKFKIQDENYVDDEEINGRVVYNHMVLEGFGLQKLKKAIVSMNPEADLAGFRPAAVAEVLQGFPARLKLGTRMYEGRPTNDVKDILPEGEGESYFGSGDE